MNFSTQKPKVFFKTFGCRTNIFDTQVMISNLKDFEVTQDEKEAGGLLRGNRLCGNQGYYPSGGDTGDHEYCASGGKTRPGQCYHPKGGGSFYQKPLKYRKADG